MFLKTRFLASLFFICLVWIVEAQAPPYFIIGNNEFANKDVYSLHFDNVNSLLYAATNDGMYAYKGNSFVPIIASPRQKGTSLLDIQEENNTIYCKNLRGQLFCISKTNKLKLVYELPVDKISLSFWYRIENERLWIITNNSISSFPIDGEVVELRKERHHLTDFFSRGHLIDNYSKLNSVIRLYSPRFGGYIDIKENQAIIHSNESTFGGSNYFELNKKIYASSIHGDVFDISSKTILDKYEYNESFQTVNENLVIGRCQTRGVHILDSNRIKNQPLRYKEHFISAVTQSSNGTLFLGTFNNGVLVVPSLKLSEIYFSGELLTSISADDNSILVSTRSGKVYDLSQDNKKLIYQSRMNFDNLHLSLINIGEISDYPKILHAPNKSIINPKDTWKINENGVLIALYNRLVLVNNEHLKRVPKYESGNSFLKNIVIGFRFKSVAYSTYYDKIYFGNNKGFFARDYLTGITKEIKYKNKSILVNDLYCHGEHIWIGTQENGIILMKQGEIIQTWDKDTSLKESQVIKLKVKDNKLYSLTSSGLCVLDDETFSYLGIEHGIAKQSITDFDFNKSNLLVMYNSSVLAIPIDFTPEKQNYSVGQLFLDSITVNNLHIDLLNRSMFAPNENSFTFYFEYRSIETRQESNVFYKLSPLDSDWIPLDKLNQNKIVFNALADGEYSFQMKANYKGDIALSKIYSFNH